MLKSRNRAGWLNTAFVVCILILVFAFGFVSGSSQSPRSQEQNATVKTSNKDDYYEPYRELRNWVFGDATGFFTLLLVSVGGFQLAMFYSQLILIRKSLIPTRMAANAAMKSASIAQRALVELEAPFISLKIINSGITRSFTETGHVFQEIQFSVLNLGRTPASIIEIADRFALIGMNENMPQPVHPDSATRNIMPRGVISPPQSESQPFTNPVGNFMRGYLVDDQLPLGKNNLFFYGFVRYSTIFNEVFRMGFCFQFDRFSERWLLSGADQYNYCQKESGPLRS